MIQYSPDQAVAVMERGEHAKALLSAPFFTEIVDHLTSYYVSQLIACKPGFSEHEDALRHAHLMQYALTDLVGTLQQFVSAGEQVSTNLLRDRAEQGDLEALHELSLDEDYD